MQVQQIIKAAKFIEPNLGELPGALKARLSDSNKNHIITTVGIIGTLASSMGSGCSKFARAFIPGIINNFSDSKVFSSRDFSRKNCQGVHNGTFNTFRGVL